MYKISSMKITDVPYALTIWHDEFNRYCKNDSFPDFWDGGKETVEQYLLKQIEKSNAIIATKDEVIVGYMAWMCFDFHSERTAFLPIVGSAAATQDENAIYHALYLVASQKWVQDDRFNHLWMTFYDDTKLIDMLYNIGFGSYVIDACQRTYPNELHPTINCKIARATEADADAVLALGDDSERNLLTPPIFLVREFWQREEIVKLINSQQVFTAWDNGRMIGLISLDTNQKHNFEHLTITDSAYIGGIGVYVRPEYRGKGIGTQLLQQAFDYCKQAGKPFLHVSFESANPDAIRFWPKYFKPAIRSVRRTVNKDANTTL